MVIYVDPGESIQEAVDSLPAEGGVVELAPGAWTIDSTLRIDKSHVTLRGAGKTETVIEGSQSMLLLSVRGPNATDPDPWTGPFLEPPDPAFIVDITIESLTLRGAEVGEWPPGYRDHHGIQIHEGWNINVNNVYIERTGGNGLLPKYSYDLDIADNTCNDTFSAIFLFRCHDGYITENICNTGGRFGIEFNAGATGFVVNGNIVSGFSTLGGIYLYGGSDYNIIRKNTCYSNRYGLYYHAGGGNNIIDGNVFRDNSKVGIYIVGSHYTNSITLKNNLIYGNNEGGIISVFQSDLEEPITVTTVSNTIYSNNGDGIYNEIPDATFDTKNNIIVNNSGYGIHRTAGTVTSTYNNINGNATGEYSGVSEGTGDLHVDPLFVDPANADFHLKSSSTCIDAGDPTSDYSNEPDYPLGYINMGAYGNTVEASIYAGDETAPAAVGNLAAGNPTSSSISLTWTAPGDDGVIGTASQYDIRYLTTEISEGNWNTATQCTGEQTPKVAGSTEAFTVTGLAPNTTYYFAIKAADEVPNWAGISNSPTATTTEGTGELVGHWKFDEGEGATAYDSSGSGNEGVIHGADWTTGVAGAALAFDGSDDYVDCGSGDSLGDFNAFSIIYWIKPANWDAVTVGVFGKGGLYSNYGFRVHYHAGGTALRIGDGVADSYYRLNPIATVGEWTHVAIVFNGSDLKLYHNAVWQDTKVTTQTSIAGESASFTIGKALSTTDFNGVLGDVRIYNYNLSDIEILALYQENLCPKPTASFTHDAQQCSS